MVDTIMMFVLANSWASDFFFKKRPVTLFGQVNQFLALQERVCQAESFLRRIQHQSVFPSNDFYALDTKILADPKRGFPTDVIFPLGESNHA